MYQRAQSCQLPYTLHSVHVGVLLPLRRTRPPRASARGTDVGMGRDRGRGEVKLRTARQTGQASISLWRYDVRGRSRRRGAMLHFRAVGLLMIYQFRRLHRCCFTLRQCWLSRPLREIRYGYGRDRVILMWRDNIG